MKLQVEVDTADQGDARVIAEGLFRLMQLAAEGTAVTAVVNGKRVHVTDGVKRSRTLPRRRAWQVNAG